LDAFVDDATGRVRLSAYRATPSTSTSGQFANVQFNVAPNAPLGTIPLVLSGYANVPPFSFTFVNGSLLIQPSGDFNGDGFYDCADINALTGAIAAQAHDPNYDLTNDGLVNLSDRDAWLAEAGAFNLGPGRAYRLADANLDGFVDGSDFNIWNSNKFTLGAEWCRGDFNADGAIDGSDFSIWNSNKFTSSFGGGRPADDEPAIHESTSVAAVDQVMREVGGDMFGQEPKEMAAVDTALTGMFIPASPLARGKRRAMARSHWHHHVDGNDLPIRSPADNGPSIYRGAAQHRH
jgi:hypothetical protein